MSTGTLTRATRPTRGPAARTAHPGLVLLRRRLGFFLVSLVVLVTVSFLLVHLIPGDPARASAGANAPESVVEARRVELGLDRPIWEQYLTFWRGLLTGDLGESIALRVPVIDVIADRGVATLQLAVLALALVLLVAVPLGLAIGALTHGSRRPGLEVGFTGISAIVAMIPEFLLGVVLVYLFAVNLDLLPVAGRSDATSFILPVLALALGPMAALTRIVRAETLTTLDQDFIRTARSKRMSRARLFGRHVLPNLLTSTLTIAGLVLGGMIAGTVLVENVFAWPGLGSTIVGSIEGQDFPLVQAIVLFYGALVLLINLVVDFVLIALDPRTALDQS